MNAPDLSAARWHKSSRSGPSGGDCVEVAGIDVARWHKSSRSGGSGGDCVEVANLAHVIAVRDSKNPDGPKLLIDAAGWRMFTDQIKANEHDLS
jgi:uncharacterized protein DUF397